MNNLNFPFMYAPNPSIGRPVFNASIYIGQPGLNPEILANQIQVYIRQENGSIVAVTQPLQTGAGGVVLYNGSPVTVLIAQTAYSVKVLNNLGGQIFYQENANASPEQPGNTNNVLSVKTVVGAADSIASVDFNFVANGQKIQPSGYYSIGDGASRVYYYDSSSSATPNGGTVISPTLGPGRVLMLDDSWVTPEDFGALPGATNYTTQLQEWASCSSKTKSFSGSFRTDEPLTFNPGDTVYASPGSIIDATIGAFVGGEVVKVEGSLTAIPDLSVSPAIAATSLTFASAPSLVSGDVFILYNPTDSSWLSARAEYREGEFCKVKTISGTTVNLWEPLYSAYTAANMDVYKLTGESIYFKNFSVKSPNTGSVEGIKVSKIIRPVLDNVKVSNSDYAGILIDKCFDSKILGPTAEQNTAAVGDEYGLVISNCHKLYAQGTFAATRHGVAVGGDDQVGCVPNRQIRICDSFIASSGGNAPGADIHGNCEDVVYSNCVIKNGGSFGGKDIFYDNCTVWGDDVGNGVCFYATEMYGGTYAVRGGQLVSYGNPNTTNRGIIDFGGNSAPFDAGVKMDAIIDLQGFSVRAPNATGALIRTRQSGNTFKVNPVVRNVTGSAPLLTQILISSYTSGQQQGDFLCVEGISGLGASGLTALAAFVGGMYSTTKSRYQRQSGSVTINTTNAANLFAAAAQPFFYTYPKAPYANANYVGGAFFGADAIDAYVGAVAAGTITPGVRTANATNFDGNFAIPVHWTVGIEEF